MNATISITKPSALINHLEPDTWQEVNRALIGKAISEFAHELLINPQEIDQTNQWKLYRILADDPHTEYRFAAKNFALDHWHIQIHSIRKFQGGIERPLDALLFIGEFVQQLGIPAAFQATYLDEISSTLYSNCFKHKYQQASAKELTQANFQEIEHAMTAGHPCFIANNGRIGFDIEDFQNYAPESNQAFKLLWLAGHKTNATFTAIQSIAYEQFIAQELGTIKLAAFTKQLVSLGVRPDDYIFIPVHPWQWYKQLATIFTADLATQKLISLGYGEDEFTAQQSIRTLHNRSHPEKHYTKTALAITNMGFMRGLSPHYMESTPHITQWINELLGDDPYLKSCGFKMLGEVATVGYKNRYYEELGKSYPQNKLLAALWRESPHQLLSGEQQLMTMAAFLHIDQEGDALLPALINSSDLSVQDWIDAYLNAYLAPLLHCFFKYELVFMPHGENLIMVMENNIPVSALMKDITEEVLVYNESLTLPEKVKRLFTPATDEMKVLSLFTDVFDCFFRFLAVILAEQANYQEEFFWKRVAHCIHRYQEAHPEYQKKYSQFNLFVPTFKRCCLNRLQLSNHKQMLNLSDPINSLKIEGELDNPIAQFALNHHQ